MINNYLKIERGIEILTNIEKVVTHGGSFHADETCAIALIEELFARYKIPKNYVIERVLTVPITYLKNPNIWVLDIGLEYNTENGNFDHHHDATLPSTNMLILNYLDTFFDLSKDYLGKPTELYNEFEKISNVDTGNCKREELKSKNSINYFVSLYNYFPLSELIHTKEEINTKRFYSALAECKDMIKAFLYGSEMPFVKTRYESEFNRLIEHVSMLRKETVDKIVFKIQKKFNCFVLFTDKEEELFEWQDVCEHLGIMLFVSPNTRGGWQIVTVNSELCPIPKHATQTWVHNKQFIATYNTKDDALTHASKIFTNFNKK